MPEYKYLTSDEVKPGMTGLEGLRRGTWFPFKYKVKTVSGAGNTYDMTINGFYVEKVRCIIDPKEKENQTNSDG